MIATPEQYRTLADLIERRQATGILMLGRNMIVSFATRYGRITGIALDDELTTIYPDGTFDMPKFLDAETMR